MSASTSIPGSPSGSRVNGMMAKKMASAKYNAPGSRYAAHSFRLFMACTLTGKRLGRPVLLQLVDTLDAHRLILARFDVSVFTGADRHLSEVGLFYPLAVLLVCFRGKVQRHNNTTSKQKNQPRRSLFQKSVCSERSMVKRLAVSGPRKIPTGPKNTRPPRTDKRTRSGCSCVP